MSAAQRDTSQSRTPDGAHGRGEGPDQGGPAGAIGALHADLVLPLHDRLEADLLRGGDGVVGYRDALLTSLFRDRPSFTLAWPDHLYIPGQADYRQYWFSAPPDDHRFRYAYTDRRGTSTADAADGRLFAWVNASGLDDERTGHAGVGARVVPTATLSYLTIGADVDLLAESRWWFLAGPDAGFATFSYSASVYVAAWAIDPVSGAWELLRPFAGRRLFSFRESGQGGSAVASQRHTFTDLSATVQVQSGRQYAVTVSFEATIDHDCRDRSGKPYRKQPGDDVRLWTSLAGQVASISASTKVLIP